MPGQTWGYPLSKDTAHTREARKYMRESKGRTMQSTLSKNIFSAARSSGDKLVVSSVKPIGPDGLASWTFSSSACRAFVSASDIVINSRAEEYTRMGDGIGIGLRTVIGRRRNKSHVYTFMYLGRVKSPYVS